MLETRKNLFLRLFQSFFPDDVILKSNIFRTLKLNLRKGKTKTKKHQNTFNQINFNNLRDFGYIHWKIKGESNSNRVILASSELRSELGIIELQLIFGRHLSNRRSLEVTNILGCLSHRLL